MQLSARIAVSLVVVVLGLFGWLLLFRTRFIVHHAGRRHPVSPGWVQNWPFHRMIFKPWYPAYLRFGGLFAWLLAVSLAAVLIVSRLR